MQFISHLGAVSGHAGGFVASHGRTGQQLRARTMHRQPRSVSQQAARALTGQLASVWRSLTAAQLHSWSALAARVLWRDAQGTTFTPSGYALFVSCNRNLLTLGLPLLTTAAPSWSPLPQFTSFTASAQLSSPTPPAFLQGFNLAWAPFPGAPLCGVLRASAALSFGRGNVRPSDLRIILPMSPCFADGAFIFNSWIAAWGAPPTSGQVTFALNLVDPLSGFAAPPVYAVAGFAAEYANPYIPGNITVEFNAVPEATLTGLVLEFNTDPEAGG
jgi:hypothetical protein